MIAVPSRSFAEVVRSLPANGPVLSLTKGLDPETGNRLSTLLSDRPAAVLSGPNFAEEIGRGLPAAAVIASEDTALAEWLQDELNSLTFRVYVNTDLVGVELCAAAKNVIALAAGGVDGLGSATTPSPRWSLADRPRWPVWAWPAARAVRRLPVSPGWAT